MRDLVLYDGGDPVWSLHWWETYHTASGHIELLLRHG